MTPPPLHPWRRRFLRIAGLSLALYVFALGVLVALEPHMVYLPNPHGPTTPAQAGLEGFTRETLAQPGRPAITYWESRASAPAPLLLYFHGNGEGLYAFSPFLKDFAAHGFHVVAMEYRGYPGAEGRPSEAALVADAVALYDAMHTRYPARPLAIWGYSLGTGVATQLAAQRPASAMVLEAPFTAVVDRGAELFPWAPVRWLMRNRYVSHEVIGAIHAPLLILHGDADIIIPIHHGKALFALANEPKQFKPYTGAGHLNLQQFGAYEDALTFLKQATR